MIDRRMAIQALAGAGALALSSQDAGAATSALPVSPAAAALYRRAVAINGNMMVPLDADEKLSAEDAAQVRRSGLTAIKSTLGGSGSMDRAATQRQLDLLRHGIEVNGDLFALVRRVEDVEAAKRRGVIGVILSFEAGEMLEGDLANIDRFRAQDVLVMGLSYNLQTPFASGVLAHPSTGLTPLGREAVARMNARGVTLDVSHSDPRSDAEVIAASRRPVLITHAGCAALQPHPRNKPDALIRQLADAGGVMGIYELPFLAPLGRQTTADIYMRHLTYALKVAGEDHVGVGTDQAVTPFVVTPQSLAEYRQGNVRRRARGVATPNEDQLQFAIGLNRSDRMAVITDRLLKAGYPARVADKVLGTNFLRVFRETWTPAA